jgi:hypothetical protein
MGEGLVSPHPQVPLRRLGQQGQQSAFICLQMAANAQGQTADKKIIGHLIQLV